MKKLALNLDDLQVSTFETTADPEEQRGTVDAYGKVYPTAVYHSCPAGYSDGDNTCWCLYEDTDMRMCCTVERCSASGMCW